MVRAASADPTVPYARPLESALTLEALHAPLRISCLCAGLKHKFAEILFRANDLRHTVRQQGYEVKDVWSKK